MAVTLPAQAQELRPLRLSLYASFATLQVLDVHSTYRGLAHGGREANPVMASLTDAPVLFLAVKVGGTVGTIYLTEKVAARRPLIALVVMGAVNSFYLMTVAHNYGVGRR
jgi:hypothetical protein